MSASRNELKKVTDNIPGQVLIGSYFYVDVLFFLVVVIKPNISHTRLVVGSANTKIN